MSNKWVMSDENWSNYYLWLREWRDNSTATWDMVDEEEDPELYADWQMEVEILENVLDKLESYLPDDFDWDSLPQPYEVNLSE